MNEEFEVETVATENIPMPSVEEIAAAHQPKDEAGDPIPQQPVAEAAPQEKPQEQTTFAKDKEANIIKLRKLADQAARERDELARRLQAYENVPKPKVESSNVDFAIKDDELVEGKHLNKAMKKIEQLEEQQQEYLRQNSKAVAAMRLRSQYPDFDKVMTPDNIEMFEASYPELANTIVTATNPYDQAASAYTLIKKFGIYTEIPYEADKQKALANTTKPRPLASVNPQKGDTPLSRANAFAEGLTETLKDQLRKEMEEARKLY